MWKQFVFLSFALLVTSSAVAATAECNGGTAKCYNGTVLECPISGGPVCKEGESCSCRCYWDSSDPVTYSASNACDAPAPKIDPKERFMHNQEVR